MTTLEIKPRWADKTAKFKGTVAAGEHVAVTIVGAAEWLSSTLRLRVVGFRGETLAQFPLLDESGSPLGAWSQTTGGDLTCELSLDTVQMMMAVPPAATIPFLFVLDNGDETTLYFKDYCEVTHWPQRRGEDSPYDLGGYKDFVADMLAEWRDFRAATDTAIKTEVRRATTVESGIASRVSRTEGGLAATQAWLASIPTACAAAAGKMKDAEGKWHDVGLVKNAKSQWTVAVDQNVSGGTGNFDAKVLATGSSAARDLSVRLGETVNVKDFGAEGNGTTDDTAAIQAALNALGVSGGVLFFPKGEYIVSKHVAANADPLSEIYPKRSAASGFYNPFPCLCLNAKANVRIVGDGAALHCDKHGQGILDLYKCEHVSIEGISFFGYAHGRGGEDDPRFPAMCTTTSGTHVAGGGMGEKGNEHGGYYYSSETSPYRNNERDTSAFTGVNGDSTETWGMFGEGAGAGYIGNDGYGILLYGDNSDIEIRDCVFDGFNFCGVSTGIDLAVAYTSETAKSDFVTVAGCSFSNIYDSGVNIDRANNVTVRDCRFRNIGHEDAIAAIDVAGAYAYHEANPGYGVCCRQTDFAPKFVTVESCDFDRCVRKGVDAHAGSGITVRGNRVRYAVRCGIEATGDGKSVVANVKICDNILEFCGYNCSATIGQTGGALGAYMRSAASPAFVATASRLSTQITGNTLVSCWGDPAVIYVPLARGCTIANNHVSGVMVGRTNTLGAIVRVGSNPEPDSSAGQGDGSEFSSGVSVHDNLADVSLPTLSGGSDFMRLTFGFMVAGAFGATIRDNILHIAEMQAQAMLTAGVKIRPFLIRWSEGFICEKNIVYAMFEANGGSGTLINRAIVGDALSPNSGVPRYGSSEGNIFATILGASGEKPYVPASTGGGS